MTWLARAALLALGLAGCVPSAVTREGREVADLYLLFSIAATGVAMLVLGLTAFAVVRYRSRPGDTTLPPQVRGNLRLEAIWTAGPILLVLALFALTFGVLTSIDVDDAEGAAPPAAEIEVAAFRWGWRFDYPAEGVTVVGVREPGPEIVIPVDEKIRIRLTAEDVNHAFFVPEFLFKRDAIPGRISEFEFTAEEVGTYRGQCAEFCGVYHARMPFTVRVETRAAYEAWLAERRDAG